MSDKLTTEEFWAVILSEESEGVDQYSSSDLEIKEEFLGTFGVRWDEEGQSYVLYKTIPLFFNEFWFFNKGEATQLIRQGYRPFERIATNRSYYAFDKMDREKNVLDLWLVTIENRNF